MKLRRLEQAVVGAGVEPGVAAAHDLDVELAQLEVALVDVGDLELAARRRLDVGRDVADLAVVEVQARDRVVALGHLGLFLDAEGAEVTVEFDHAIALGVVHMIGKHAGALGARIGIAQLLGQVMAVEDVVAQHQRARAVVDEVLADDEGLGQAVRTGLDRVLDVHAPLAAVAQQVGKARRVLRRADQQHVADAAEHQRAQRVIDHGLVVDRHQLLADSLGRGVETGAGATGQDDAFAISHDGFD